MRKKLLLILLCVACMSLGGCFIEQAPLNDKELGVVAQYAADLLLKYNKNYRDVLLTTEELTPTPTRESLFLTGTPTSTPTSNPDSTGTPSVSPENTNIPSKAPSNTPTPTASPTPSPSPTDIPDNTEETFKKLAKVIGAENLVVSYSGFSEPFAEGDYPVNSGNITLKKRDDGKYYFIVKFVITNERNTVEALHCYEQDLTCILNVDGKNTMYPCEVLDMSDLRYQGISKDAPDEVALGDRYETILIFAVKKDTDLSRAILTLANKNGESVVIKIK